MGAQNSTRENVADWNRKAASRASYAAQQAEKTGDYLKAARLREDQARYLANIEVAERRHERRAA